MKILSFSLLVVCFLMVLSHNGVIGQFEFISQSKAKSQIKPSAIKALKFIFKNKQLIVTGKNHNRKSIISLKNSLEKVLINQKVKSLTFTYKEGIVVLSQKTKLSEKKTEQVINALDNEFTKYVKKSNKSFLDLLNFKDYREYGPHGEVYYERKGLSTKWIVLIIVLIIILILICCCVLFCMGCFKTCCDMD